MCGTTIFVIFSLVRLVFGMRFGIFIEMSQPYRWGWLRLDSIDGKYFNIPFSSADTGIYRMLVEVKGPPLAELPEMQIGNDSEELAFINI